jgi:hypothetical protein
MAKYQWKKDGPTPTISAQVFGETVEKISTDLTSAKAEDIVNAARPSKSPIHKMFEWRNNKAAELYRRAQARNFIGSLQIVRVEFSEGPTVSNRAFFLVKTGDRTGYIDHERILSDRDLKVQVLETARQELENYVRKFGSVMALGNYIQRLQAVIDEMRDNADSLLSEASQRRPATGAADSSSAAAGAVA